MLKKDLEALVAKQQLLIQQLAGMVRESADLVEVLHEQAKDNIDPLWQTRCALRNVSNRVEEILNAEPSQPRDEGSTKSS